MIETLKRNIFLSAPGFAILVLLFAGILKGFNGAHITGVLGLFLIHHREDIAGLFRKATGSESEAVVVQRQIELLKNELSKANMAIAFKTGTKPELKP